MSNRKRNLLISVAIGMMIVTIVGCVWGLFGLSIGARFTRAPDVGVNVHVGLVPLGSPTATAAATEAAEVSASLEPTPTATPVIVVETVVVTETVEVEKIVEVTPEPTAIPATDEPTEEVSEVDPTATPTRKPTATATRRPTSTRPRPTATSTSEPTTVRDLPTADTGQTIEVSDLPSRAARRRAIDMCALAPSEGVVWVSGYLVECINPPQREIGSEWVDPPGTYSVSSAAWISDSGQQALQSQAAMANSGDLACATVKIPGDYSYEPGTHPSAKVGYTKEVVANGLRLEWVTEVAWSYNPLGAVSEMCQSPAVHPWTFDLHFMKMKQVGGDWELYREGWIKLDKECVNLQDELPVFDSPDDRKSAWYTRTLDESNPLTEEANDTADSIRVCVPDDLPEGTQLGCLFQDDDQDSSWQVNGRMCLYFRGRR